MFNLTFKKTGGLAQGRFFFALVSIAAALLTVPEARKIFTAGEGAFSLGPAVQFLDSGRCLFYGIYDPNVGGKMPLFSLIAGAFLDELSRHGTSALLLLFNAGIYYLSFLAGRAGRGPEAGLAALFAAALFNLAPGAPVEIEQVVYSFFLLLLLNLLIRGRQAGPRGGLYTGLGAGLTMLVRSPLLLFPPFLAAWEYAARKLGRGAPAPAALSRTALLLGSAYLLLLPWTGLKYFMYRELAPFELNRVESAVSASALGSVYNLEFDYRGVAGLGRNGDVLAWAARETAGHPGRFLGAWLERLGAIVLLHPLLFLLGLAALRFYRRGEFEAALPLFVYFVAVHSLLAVEARYLYPLRYFTAVLAGWGFHRLLNLRAGAESQRTAARLFYAAVCFAAVTEVFVIAYPFRARPARNLAVIDRAAAFFPGDTWLPLKRGELLLLGGDPEAGLAALGEAYERSGGRNLRAGYMVRTMRAVSPAELRPPPEDVPGLNVAELYMLKGLKELEFDERKSAGRSFKQAYRYWSRDADISRGPAARAGVDAEVLGAARQVDRRFWVSCLNRAAVFWRPAARATLLARLGELEPATRGLSAEVRGAY